MVQTQADWSLATFSIDQQPVAALEVAGRAYRLEPSLARVGWPGQNSARALFDDWARALPALQAASGQVIDGEAVVIEEYRVIGVSEAPSETPVETPPNTPPR